MLFPPLSKYLPLLGALFLKWIHLLSTTLMFGTAFYMFFASRSGNVQAIAFVSRWVVKADTWFTTPAVIIQPITGWLMLQKMEMPLNKNHCLSCIGAMNTSGPYSASRLSLVWWWLIVHKGW